MLFKNRTHAGQILASKLQQYQNNQNVIVLALPRGGVPVAAEISKTLAATLDVILVRKLGLPHHPELAMGAIAVGGVTVLDQKLIRRIGLGNKEIEHAIHREQRELAAREQRYKIDNNKLDIRDKFVILVDDGLATGQTMQAAVKFVRNKEASQVIVAVPVCPTDTAKQFKSLVDEFVCPYVKDNFTAVGEWYEDFSQTTDREVVEILQKQ